MYNKSQKNIKILFLFLIIICICCVDVAKAEYIKILDDKIKGGAPFLICSNIIYSFSGRVARYSTERTPNALLKANYINHFIGGKYYGSANDKNKFCIFIKHKNKASHKKEVFLHLYDLLGDSNPSKIINLSKYPKQWFKRNFKNRSCMAYNGSNVYWCAYNSQRKKNIFILNLETENIIGWNTKTTAPEPKTDYAKPTTIAVTPNNTLLIGFSKGVVAEYKPDGTFLRNFYQSTNGTPHKIGSVRICPEKGTVAIGQKISKKIYRNWNVGFFTTNSIFICGLEIGRDASLYNFAFDKRGDLYTENYIFGYVGLRLWSWNCNNENYALANKTNEISVVVQNVNEDDILNVTGTLICTNSAVNIISENVSWPSLPKLEGVSSPNPFLVWFPESMTNTFVPFELLLQSANTEIIYSNKFTIKVKF